MIPEITLKPFHELAVGELYALLKLRSDVFVVEQQSIYHDLDGYDQSALHVLAQDDQGLAGYVRLLPAGLKYDEPAFGRLVVAPRARKTGVSATLIHEALGSIHARWPNLPTRIEAQAYLKDYYTRFGFVPEGDIYSMDGIPHIQMLRIP